jgi:predicted nucleic-acid-binding Zn-ribbon protein
MKDDIFECAKCAHHFKSEEGVKVQVNPRRKPNRPWAWVTTCPKCGYDGYYVVERKRPQ